ncbi:helix-turn-helix transcriptional regulator [Streptomyces kunmingensis]|uniref:Helix-turn-helix transcriptional regulator n=1 Tax=Streptomyces kunmingensis TaxID=68225 RepID=A0ABU6CE68_9ACTN|nr:helix-turn-helix transcriptional regulator [Streptomyces kunmingensis]MEB3963008.1 helix-turn-helix transcriptional regulator [Streptomyces kunmingensis]
MRMRVPAIPPASFGRTVGTTSDNVLGDFLRIHRSRLAPSATGLFPGGRGRRVQGLRREEVAVLTGVSVDYYSRLEQGRERNPSAHIVEALGQALQLDPDVRDHLFRLAGHNPCLCPDSTLEHVHPALLQLLEKYPQAVAYVLSPCLDILTVNAYARALLSPLGSELNMIRSLFTRPEAREFFAEWPSAVTASLHTLRLNSAQLPDDTQLVDLVTEMSALSPDFSGAWQDHKALDLERGYSTVVHPEAGRIELSYRAFSVQAAPGQRLLVGTPEHGSRSAEALTYLTAMGGPQQPMRRSRNSPAQWAG